MGTTHEIANGNDCKEGLMTLKDVERNTKKIIDGYCLKHSISPDADWYIMKMQEELGELMAAHLKLTGRGRTKDKSKDELEQNFRDEIADVIAITILFAQHQGIDVENSLKEKWFKHL